MTFFSVNTWDYNSTKHHLLRGGGGGGGGRSSLCKNSEIHGITDVVLHVPDPFSKGLAPARLSLMYNQLSVAITDNYY